MSETLNTFKTHAKNKNWIEAIKYCNGLSMTEMLEGLDSLGPGLLAEFAAQLSVSGSGTFTARIDWAIQVVQLRKIPDGPAPGDLAQTGQVEVARKFLAKPKAKPAGKKKLKLTLFWTKGALTETVTPTLVQKAQDFLKANGDQFVLDISYRKNVLDIERTIDFEIDGCGDSGVDEVRKKIEESKIVPNDRLAVVFCTPFATANMANLTHGLQCKKEGGRRVVLINVTSVNPDKLTLIHEVGHGADIGHELQDNDNFMSYGTSRTKMYPLQSKKFEKAFFCS